MNITTKENNPNSNGKIEAPIVIIDKINNSIILRNKHISKNNLKLHLHPFIAAYITKGLISLRVKRF